MSQVGFYQVGGDLRFQHPSYVKRKADEDLYQALKSGEFCYVFNSRQMGKSSLGIQIQQRLRGDGYACCFISLTEIGSEATADEWYFSLADIIASKLNISDDVSDWWNEHESMPALSRFGHFIKTVLLREVEQNIVIFIDEIDSVRRLKFRADDFFALIRSFYNNRVEQPEYKRLTFTLLGVSTPSDLIQSENCTPFNIGRAISLKGFQLHEAQPLAKGLLEKSTHPEEILEEILYWSGGQPFLTQKLCKLVAESAELIPSESAARFVEKLIQDKIIYNWEEQDNPEHLKTIRNRLLNNGNLIRRLLQVYQSILKNKEISSDDSSEQLELQLSGLVVNQDGKLKIRNPIYAQVFNRDWLEQKLDELSPYSESITAWRTSSFTDKSHLLRGQALKNALQWSNDKSLSDKDYKYLNASQEAESDIQEAESVRKLRNVVLIVGSFVIGTILSVSFGAYNLAYEAYEKYDACPIEKGIVGEKIGDTCFRTLKTSGEKIASLSGSNFHLKKGTEFFKQQKYEQAIKLFAQAIDSDPTDPVPQIYLNNAQARLKGNPLKIAVVASIDYYEDAAREMFRGVADAQTKFNHQNGKDNHLLEIVIVNDGNEPEVAKKVAKELANDNDILAIIGHHASESTAVALPIYQEKQIAVVSPASSSSQLKKENFFRTVSSTKVAAPKYTQYIKKHLQLDEIAIAYNPSSEYSNTLKRDFEEDFKKHGGKFFGKLIDLSETDLDIQNEIDNLIKHNIKAVLLISNVGTNSVALAIARANFKLPAKKLQLVSAMALSEKLTLEKGGDAIEGMVVPSPCLAKNSDYTKKAEKRWEQQIYWRAATSYDAAQALIAAIRISKEPTREEILKNLGSLKLPINQTSGFGLNWSSSNDYHSNTLRKYCLFQIRHHRFEEISEK